MAPPIVQEIQSTTTVPHGSGGHGSLFTPPPPPFIHGFWRTKARWPATPPDEHRYIGIISSFCYPREETT